MIDYDKQFNLDAVTLHDCMVLCEREGLRVILNDGQVINFEKEE